MIEATLYIRFSSDEQESGDSVRRQKDLGHEYAEKNGLKIIEEVVDSGVSAFRGLNFTEGNLGKWLKKAETGNAPKKLLVENLDRITRLPARKAYNKITSILETNDTEIISFSDNKIYKEEEDNIFDILMIFIKSQQNWEESKKKSDRLYAIWEQKRKNANHKLITRILPNWLFVDEKENIQLDENKSSVIKLIFELSKSGIGTKGITRYLNENKIKNFGKSEIWGKSYVTKILNNPATFGRFIHYKMLDGKRTRTGDITDDYYPKVIDKKLFDLIQYRLKQRRVNKTGGQKLDKLRNLFSGKVKCGICNSSVVFMNKNYKKDEIFFRCYNSMDARGCGFSSWKYSEFEKDFIENISQLNIKELLYDNSDDKLVDKIVEIKNEIIVLNDKIENNLNAVDETNDSNIRQRLIKRIDSFSQELQNKEKELHEIETEIHVPNHKSIIDNIDNIDLKDSKLRAKIRQNILDTIDFIKLFTPTIDTMPTSDIEYKDLKPKRFNYPFSNEIINKLHDPRTKLYREWAKFCRYYIVKFHKGGSVIRDSNGLHYELTSTIQLTLES